MGSVTGVHGLSEDPLPARVPLRRRVPDAMRLRQNWWQLARFAAVGASGYVVNLASFALAVHGAGLDYRLAAVLAFVVAVTNNFFLNRHWTFDASSGHAGFQAARFLCVSLGAFVASLALLELLVAGLGLDEVLAQAIAVLCATPLNFVGNRLWSFRS